VLGRGWWTKRIGRLVLPGEFSDALNFNSLTPAAVADETPITVHMLWVDGALSPLEQLSCVSFLRNGYRVQLWTYGALTGVPPGVLVQDASQILSAGRLFRDPEGSLAAFSDLFRYWVLSEQGGLWSDMDVICLTPSRELRSRLAGGFLVTEHARDWRRRQVTNNLIFAPQPQPGGIIDLARAVAERFDPSRLSWGDCGPRLLTALVKTYPRLRPALMDPDFANPFPSRAFPHAVLTPGAQLAANAAFLHCYNERWRKLGVDKSAPWHPESILGALKRRMEMQSINSRA
jgi:hypothetical protein